MRTSSPTRQLILFFIAVILPSAVLVALGLFMIGQERQLSEQRETEERARLAREIGHGLLGQLERIKLEETGSWWRRASADAPPRPSDAAVGFVGSVVDGRLLLPWEMDSRIAASGNRLHEPTFARRIEKAEQKEFAEHDVDGAAAIYEALSREAAYPDQRAYAALLHTRALTKSGRVDDASRHFEELLALPSNVTDEMGVPLAYYAMRPLLRAAPPRRSVYDRIQAEWRAKQWLSPTAAYMLRDVTDDLAQMGPDGVSDAELQNLRHASSDYVALLEGIYAFKRDFPALLLQRRRLGVDAGDDSAWLSYGDEPWLVGFSDSADQGAAGDGLIVVVKTRALVDSWSQDAPNGIRAADIQLVRDAAAGETLGRAFPDLGVVLARHVVASAITGWPERSSIYLVALLLVLSTTFFGAYLLWRDTEREVRLAALRSGFVASVTHELKTPLTSIRMMAETLKMGRASDPEAAGQYLDTIVGESERLTRLINNALDFSKIEQGSKRYRMEPCSLEDVVHAAAAAMSYPLEQQGFTLELDVAGGLPNVVADRDAVEQALLNLLVNAVKYSGETRDVGMRLYRHNGEACLEVSDRGIGIAGTDQAHIFDEFFRGAGAEKEQVPGAGLGLAIVAHVTEAHGGRISMKSQPGEGSTFTLHLPLPDEEST